MTTQPRTKEMIAKVVEAYERLGTISGAARALGMSRTTTRNHLRDGGHYDEKPMYAGRVISMEVKNLVLPRKGEIQRYFLTSAQNNTLVAPKVWDTILNLVDYYDAQLMVGTFTYNKASYGTKSAKRGRGPTATDHADLWYDPEILDYIVDEPVRLAPGLEWRGEQNILPTAVRPLSDLEKYTGRASGIFPHAKLAMASVASGKHEATKFNYTTGTVTKRNYIQKKAGLKADFHHSYSGLIVEVNSDGDWFVRQVVVDKSGVAYDLDKRFTPDDMSEGHHLKTVVWGDIHTASIDEGIAELCWGEGGVMDALKPEFQFMHDILDFRARNGHTFKKRLIHDRFAAYIMGHDEVEVEISGVSKLLCETARPWCKTYIVDSNHDAFMMEWLRIGDYRTDPVNAIYFLEAQLHVYKSIEKDPEKPVNLLRWAVERDNGQREDTVFLDEDQPLVIQNINYDIHGHRGPGGSRGSPIGLSKMGRAVSHGHIHSAGILDGVYTSGLTGKNDQGYNKGPSSWSASHIFGYQNGTRAIITMWNGKWRL